MGLPGPILIESEMLKSTSQPLHASQAAHTEVSGEGGGLQDSILDKLFRLSDSENNSQEDSDGGI